MILFVQDSATKATKIFYVVPDYLTNSSCPYRPCGTLNQYLFDNGTLPAVSDVEYHLLPGEHKINNNIVLQNLQNFSLVGTYSQKPTVLACNGQSNIAIIFSYNVTISNLVFKQCNGNTVHDSDSMLDYDLRAIRTSLFIESCLCCTIYAIKFLQHGFIGINVVENSRLNNITVILNGLHSSGIFLWYSDHENRSGHDLIILSGITVTGNGGKGIHIEMMQTQYIISVIIMKSQFYFMNRTVLQVRTPTFVGLHTRSKIYKLLIKSS